MAVSQASFSRYVNTSGRAFRMRNVSCSLAQLRSPPSALLQHSGMPSDASSIPSCPPSRYYFKVAGYDPGQSTMSSGTIEPGQERPARLGLGTHFGA